MISPERARRFWKHVQINGPDECWPWIGTCYPNGYGQVSIKGRRMVAHRAAWITMNGPVEPGVKILHDCDNPPCCNPAHLFKGTMADNMADMVRKGRASCQIGNRHGAGKLTLAQVEVIRQRVLLDGASQASVARDFGVHQTTVNQIIRGRLWRPGHIRARQG